MVFNAYKSLQRLWHNACNILPWEDGLNDVIPVNI